jgi:tRNA threonylcarbamoyladenosine dehydratase
VKHAPVPAQASDATPAAPTAESPTESPTEAPADLERRFGALRRLYGDAGYARLRGACVAVVGLGGVGSWTVEALARSGVAGLLLIDMDHIAESNINRQVQALGETLGQHKAQALRARIQDIHPSCQVDVIDDFVSAENWPALYTQHLSNRKATRKAPGLIPQVWVDACDQVRAKEALAVWALKNQLPLVCVGAAGGKRQAQAVDVQDLADTTHDPLLASLRQRLRKAGAVPRGGQGRMGLRCVFSREAVLTPVVAEGAAGAHGDQANDDTNASTHDGTLNCHGYGSSVTVTATFGMVAAGEAITQLLALPDSSAG